MLQHRHTKFLYRMLMAAESGYYTPATDFQIYRRLRDHYRVPRIHFYVCVIPDIATNTAR